MKLFHKLSVFALAGFLFAACSSENELPNTPPDAGGKTDANSQEVTLILKNKVSLTPSATKAPIATEEENYISSLDVYVFASESENGPYTFQELFYYRDDPSETIAQNWAHTFTLSTTDNTSTGLLRLTKGLYVKLLCIANQTQLYSTAADGTASEYTDFAPLSQTAPGQPDNVVTPGRPTLAEFEALHTPLINPTVTTDFIETPLPMAGAGNGVIDLTDFTVTTRRQSSLTLNRMVARFDVINDSEKSKFKLTGIALANGRKGCTFFPIKPVGAEPAATDDLIQYPFRIVSAAQKGSEDDAANNVITTKMTGAFYMYPSPKEDGGYLLLKGVYYPNKTEQRDVTYQVPFEPIGGLGNYIEVAANHRYTVAITEAGEAKLDFTVSVLPWEDGGDVDSYEPDNDFTEGPVTLIADAAALSGTHLLADGTISALAATGTKFAFHMGSNAAIDEKLVYEGDAWIVKDETVRTGLLTKAALDTVFAYKIVDDATLAGFTNIKPVTIRLTNKASGKKKDIKIIPTPGPEVVVSASDASDNRNTYDAGTRTLTLYNVANSAKVFTVTAEDLSTDDAANTGSSVTPTGCDWLTVSPASVTDATGDYTFTLAAAQTPIPAAGTLTFTATATGATTVVNVVLKDPSPVIMEASFDNKGNANNSYAAATSTITLEGVAGNSFSIQVTSPEGVTPSVTGGSDWLNIVSDSKVTSDGSSVVTITGNLIDGVDVSAGKSDGVITLANVITGGGDKTINVAVPAAPAPAPDPAPAP